MAENETTSDDLRSLLSQSFDQATAPVAEDKVSAKASEAPSDGDAADAGEAKAAPKAKSEDPPRHEDGKFAKKEAAADKEPTEPKEPETKEAKAKEAEAAEAKPDAEKDKATEAKAGASKEPPANWSASDKAMFKLQSPEAQEFLLRRYKDMQGDYDRKSGALSDLKKEYEPVQQLFAPYVDVLKQKGLTPQTVIRRWADVETALANGRGVDIIDGIVKSYGVDKGQLAKRLGFTSGQAAEPATEKPAVDPANPANGGAPHPIQLPPEVAEELRQLRTRLDVREQTEQLAKTQAARDREAAVEAEITNFKSATDEKGGLLHPYFEEVEPAMIALASSYAASKQPIPKLGELYETAVWANPSTRAALLATQKAADQARAAEEARAKAASARKAGSSVTGAPGSGQASSKIRADLSLREQLEEAAAEMA